MQILFPNRSEFFLGPQKSLSKAKCWWNVHVALLWISMQMLLHLPCVTFRAWQGEDRMQWHLFFRGSEGILLQFRGQAVLWWIQISPFFFIFTRSDLEHTLLQLCYLHALTLFYKAVFICPHLLGVLLLHSFPFQHRSF